jgi:hypothetical protein
VNALRIGTSKTALRFFAGERRIEPQIHLNKVLSAIGCGSLRHFLARNLGSLFGWKSVDH